MNAPRHGDFIVTASGRRFWPLDPRADEISIDDIAHALANLCRFAGHTQAFYSVAQHSVIVSEICGNDVVGLWGLLHDASEAYLCDIVRPVKHAPALKGYREAEDAVMGAIVARFGLGAGEPPLVKEADILVLEAEKRDLMRMPADWQSKRPAHPLPITAMPPNVAKAAFLKRFNDLAGTLGITA